MRRMLPAPVAELLQFQTIRCRFAVLGLRIIPLFAITALQRNNFPLTPQKLLAFVSSTIFVRDGISHALQSVGLYFRMTLTY